MTRGPRARAVLLGAAVLAAGAAASPAPAGHGAAAREIVARDSGGEPVAALALPRSGRFALGYRHSTYRAPALERFRAAADGSFRLEAVSSPSQGVLDYYELDGRRERRGGWWTLRPDRPARFATMALIGTPVGRRTLVVGSRRAALHRAGRSAVHLRLAVEGG